jgi:hypothetical protein
MARVRWSRTFEKSFRKLPAQMQDGAFRVVWNLLEDPARPSLNLELYRSQSSSCARESVEASRYFTITGV